MAISFEPVRMTVTNYKWFYSPSTIYKGARTNSVKSADESVVADKLMLTIYDPQSQIWS
jgi:hypothetical protein